MSETKVAPFNKSIPIGEVRGNQVYLNDHGINQLELGLRQRTGGNTDKVETVNLLASSANSTANTANTTATQNTVDIASVDALQAYSTRNLSRTGTHDNLIQDLLRLQYYT